MKRLAEGKRVALLERDGWEFAERKKGKEAVAVVAETADGRLILTEQPRKPVNAAVIDLPAGLVGDDGGSNPEETARRELEEETGYACGAVELLARGPSSPGITSEIISLYRARDLRQVGEGGGVGEETIRVHTIPTAGIRGWLQEQERVGKLIDLKVWSALFFLTQG
jgi:ADP-ribose pyrophosphatase